MPRALAQWCGNLTSPRLSESQFGAYRDECRTRGSVDGVATEVSQIHREARNVEQSFASSSEIKFDRFAGAMTEPLTTNPNRLVEAYRSYSHAISAEILKKLPSSVDRDDVIGAAELGLVEAARNFDPSRGVLFKTFAYYRIRGAVYDALRKMGWLRGDSKLRFEAGANEYIKDYTEAGAGEAASPQDAYRELQQVTSAVLTSYLLSIDASNTELADPNGVSAEEALVNKQAHERVHAALSQLPANNRKLIEEYYFHDATLEEIGGRMGLSKSWVCRLHAKSLDMLRDAMRQLDAPSPRKSSQALATADFQVR
jgi:RNA polymerase sigma factor FliA